EAPQRALALMEVGQLGQALTDAEALAPRLQDGDNVPFFGMLRACQARALAEQGRDAGRAVEEALRIARATGHPIWLATTAATVAPALRKALAPAATRALLAELAASGGHDN